MNVSARRLAFEVLADVEIAGQYSNLILPKRLRESGLPQSDRSFTTQLVYGTLRMQGQLDFLIGKLSTRPLSEIDTKVLILLRLGIFQLLHLSTSDHAATYETTELAKTVAGKSTAGFVNAILRNAIREESALRKEIESADLAIRYSHPQWIVDAYSDLLGEDVESILKANNMIATPTLIAWPGRSDRDELIAAGGIPIAGSTVAVTFDGNPGEISAIRERRAGVQDYGSQLVVELFYQTRDSHTRRWLDLCAGPGGKAAYLDSLISDGELIANEISQERSQLISQVVKRGKVVTGDGRQLPDSIGDFDRILVDAPCSGLGALRRRPEVRWRRKPSDIGPLRTLQRELLDSADSHLVLGGIIGYATCSPHLAETTGQVNDFLRRHPNYERVEIEHSATNRYGDLQLWTDRDGTDAMYLSLLRKRSA